MAVHSDKLVIRIGHPDQILEPGEVAGEAKTRRERVMAVIGRDFDRLCDLYADALDRLDALREERDGLRNEVWRLQRKAES